MGSPQPCLPPTFCIHLSAFFLVTTSIPIHYHPILSPYLATTLSLASTLYTLHLPVFTFYFTSLFLLSNAVLHSLEQKQSISLIFIYFYRAHREKVFVCRKFSKKSPAVCIPYSIREVNDNLKIA